ncbi:MAG: LacI family DNA-binding transcriptional regulator [Christensenellales bacterium]
MPKAKITSIKDVAALANVSISTVSHVLNRSKNVSSGLSKRVMDAVEELGYEINPIASGLKSGKTNMIGVVVTTIANIFYSELLHSIHAAALKKNYNVCIYETQQNLEHEIRYIDVLKSRWVEGILLTSCLDTDRPEAPGYIKKLTTLNINRKRIPVVCIDAAISETLDAVTADNRVAMFKATQHMFDIGKRNIAYVAAPFYFQNGKDRKMGYLDALQRNSAPIRQEFIVEGDFSPESGAACMRKLLSLGLPIDGVAVGSDQMGVGVIWELKQRGFRIPQDIAVTGFDDNFPATLISPSLSTMRVSKEKLGSYAFDLLIERINNPGAPRKLVELESELIVRQSTDFEKETAWSLKEWS